MELLSQKRVATELGISHRTLEKWRVVGGGPRFIRVGRLVRYRQEDVQDWMRSRTVSNTTEADQLLTGKDAK